MAGLGTLPLMLFSILFLSFLPLVLGFIVVLATLIFGTLAYNYLVAREGLANQGYRFVLFFTFPILLCFAVMYI